MQAKKEYCNYFSINEKKKLVNLFSNNLDTKSLSNCLVNYKDYLFQIWVKIDSIDFKKRIINLKKIGFHPYIFAVFERNMYIITRNNTNITNLLDLFSKYYKQTYTNKNLILFSEKRIRKFKRLVKQPNEVSGTISYDTIFINNDKNWKYINGDTKDNDGNEDSVLINYNKITYHTHPIPTYKKKEVYSYAWPSLQDYLTVYEIGQYRKEIVYHLVLAREGIYLIVYNPELKIDKSQIEKNMDIDYDTISLYQFLTKINTNSIKTYFKRWSDNECIKFIL